MKRLSIRWRLTLWYGMVLSAILVGFSVTVYALMRHHLLALTDAALAEELADLSGDVLLCERINDLPRELGLRYASHDGYEVEVSDLRGAIHFRSDGLAPGALPLPRPGTTSRSRDFASVMVEGLGRERLARNVVSRADGTLVVQVVVSLVPNERALRELLMVLLFTLPPVVAGALAGGYLLARTALAPVDRMAAIAQEITSARLDRRVTAPNPNDELGRLANTLNDMIVRLQRSFDEVRRFTADAAHELRTPLASMRTGAEVALRAPRSAERDEAVLVDLLEEIERLNRLVTQLLFLSREDAGLQPGRRQPVRLDEIALDVVNHMQVAAKDKGLALEISIQQPCVVLGEPDRLRQLFFNLLDNSIKYTPSGGHIVISGVCSEGWTRVAVADSGIGISAIHLPRIFDRFYRVDPSRSRDVDGTGLGLAICRSISEAHGGRIGARSDAGKGCTITVELPNWNGSATT